MLGHDYFYRSLIRNYVVAFGTLFSGIRIKDWNSNTSVWVQDVRVPVSYGSKEKHLARVYARENSTDDVAITLPRIAFVITDISYDASRVLNRKNKITRRTNLNESKLQPGIPYDINFELAILTKKNEDATKIVEQIIPFFSPEMFLTLKIQYGVEGDGTTDYLKLDTPVILNSVSTEDTYEGDFESRRAITWTLNFTMKAKFYGPITSEGLINKAIIDFPWQQETMTIIPIVDGKELAEITPSDDYGYSETIETNYD